jgi:malonyl CoA-acyl carrier protein transacylase
MYIANALHYYDAVKSGERPALLAGHSLGEYNALLAAGAFDFLTGLRLVQRRGALMSRAQEGGMGAVLGLPAARVPAVLAANDLMALDVATYNSATHTVVSGPSEQISRARRCFESAGARILLTLPVSGAFHSRYMAECARAFADVLATVTFRPLAIPVIANVTGAPYPDGDQTPAIGAMLTQQLTAPVRWADTIRYAIAQGTTRFREIGPGATLTKLVKDIATELEDESIAQRQSSLPSSPLVTSAAPSEPTLDCLTGAVVENGPTIEMELERRWFEAHRSALSAEVELLVTGGGGVAGRLAAERLARANADKVSIMHRIEAFEDALIGDDARMGEPPLV